MKYILMDVEGTTTSIRFVHDVLFPYSNKALDKVLLPEFKNYFQAVCERLSPAEPDQVQAEAVVQALRHWIETDQKEPSLKALQGVLWEYGYKHRHFHGHVYSDVPQAFKRWTQAGYQLGIYSSGSVLAQKLLFQHTDFGDLTVYLKNHFDTGVGLKREKQSYSNIVQQLALFPHDILFLSDIEAECLAAQEAGLKCALLNRDGVTSSVHFPVYRDFDQVHAGELSG